MLPFVELTLVDLSLEVENDANDHGRNLKQYVAFLRESQRIVTSAEACRVANAVHELDKPSLSVQELIRKATSSRNRIVKSDWLHASVLKFLKLSDQYLAFTSILFKSQAFYLSLAPLLIHDDDEDHSSYYQPLPIIELPRTEHGKPFIPPPCDHTHKDAHACYPLSISHQFPFAGMARLVASEKVNQQPRVQPVLVGLDIVVFEDYNPRLYDSTLEFVNVFQDSFSEWEWENGILKFESYGPKVLLQELYLRWSMKEAYTKAMGLGMSAEFSSFETHLHDTESEHQGLSALIEHAEEGIYLTASIVKTKSQEGSSLGDWDFFFRPLYVLSDDEPKPPLACACVCVGPKSSLHASAQSASTIIKTRKMHFEDLLRWHTIVKS